jgi:hypothetical protein
MGESSFDKICNCCSTCHIFFGDIVAFLWYIFYFGEMSDMKEKTKELIKILSVTAVVCGGLVVGLALLKSLSLMFGY